MDEYYNFELNYFLILNLIYFFKSEKFKKSLNSLELDQTLKYMPKIFQTRPDQVYISLGLCGFGPLSCAINDTRPIRYNFLKKHNNKMYRLLN